MGGPADDAAIRAVQPSGRTDGATFGGIDDLEHGTGRCAGKGGVRRKRGVFGMAWGVKLLHQGRQHEARFHTARQMADGGWQHLGTIRTDIALCAQVGQQAGLGFGTTPPCPMARTAAHAHHPSVRRIRLGKPFGRGQQREHIEQEGGGMAGPRQAGNPAAVGTPRPHADHVGRRDTHRPRIARAIARTGLPRHGSDGDGPVPVHLVGPPHLAHGPEGMVERHPVAKGEAGAGRRVGIASGHPGVARHHIGQADFRTAQDERKPVVGSRTVERRKPRLLQHTDKTPHAVRLKQVHTRDVERERQGLVGPNGPGIGAIEILGCESPEISRHVGKQGLGEQPSLLQGRSIEKRLKDAARRAVGPGHVHPPALTFGQGVGVAHIGHEAAALHLGDDHGHIADMLLPQRPAPLVGQFLHALLQSKVDRSGRPSSRSRAMEMLHPVECMLRHRAGRADKRFANGQGIVGIGQFALLVQAGQQPVAFGKQHIAATARPHQRGTVLQDRQRGGLRPREFHLVASQIAPHGSPDAHHVAAKRGVGGVELQNLVFAVADFQTRGQESLDNLLPQRTGGTA